MELLALVPTVVTDLVTGLVTGLATAADPVPRAEDVKAGWTAFWVFVALAAATALLLWSFVRQLRRTRANAERGVFGEREPGRRTEHEATDEEQGLPATGSEPRDTP